MICHRQIIVVWYTCDQRTTKRDNVSVNTLYQYCSLWTNIQGRWHRRLSNFLGKTEVQIHVTTISEVWLYRNSKRLVTSVEYSCEKNSRFGYDSSRVSISKLCFEHFRRPTSPTFTGFVGYFTYSITCYVICVWLWRAAMVGIRLCASLLLHIKEAEDYIGDTIK